MWRCMHLYSRLRASLLAWYLEHLGWASREPWRLMRYECAKWGGMWWMWAFMVEKARLDGSHEMGETETTWKEKGGGRQARILATYEIGSGWCLNQMGGVWLWEVGWGRVS